MHPSTQTTLEPDEIMATALAVANIAHAVLSPHLPAEASPIERCDAEIACALDAILTGSRPLDDALLYWTDWNWERKLLLAEQAGQLEEAQAELRKVLGRERSAQPDPKPHVGEPK
jgi:hypothetical protein